ncbi:DUF2061 domain-containing protein [Pseudaquabacterium rugosum]|uniref:DUF2061 domain-containing protein n=1 Tax=Pseudaquabacterium rugosum TaxID=2984194 RepID=UPI003BF9982A
MAKTLSFGVLHLGIAFGVSYALSGSVAVAGAVTLVEPLCNMVAHYFFDGWWARREAAKGAARAAAAASQAPRWSAGEGAVPVRAPSAAMASGPVGSRPQLQTQEQVAHGWALRARLAA